jgi:phosphoglucosamine mutase
MTNFALEQRFAQLGIPFARSAVGDRYVLEGLQERGWLWGGEGSGHILCLDRHTTGDGIISALQVLAAIRSTGRTMSQLTGDLVLMPQVLVNLRLPSGFRWQTHAPLLREKAAVEGELAERGRLLIRASGTEPVLRVMVEATEAPLAERLAQRLVAALPGVRVAD